MLIYSVIKNNNGIIKNNNNNNNNKHVHSNYIIANFARNHPAEPQALLCIHLRRV